MDPDNLFFPEEPVTTIDKLIEDLMKPTPISYGAQLDVDITYFENPENFYVRLLKYSDVLMELTARGPQLQANEIRFRSSVVYFSKKCDTYVRGEILSLVYNNGEASCDINAIDYGYIEESVPATELWMPLNETEVPPLAIKCRLDTNRHPREQYLAKVPVPLADIFTATGSILVKNTSTDAVTVTVFNDCGRDVTTELEESGHAFFGYGIINNSTYKNIYLQNKQALDIVMLYGDYRQFYVAPLPMFTWWLNLQEEFDKYAKLQDSLNPSHVKVNLPVGAYHKEKSRYERAIIKEIVVPGKVVMVELVDAGKSREMELIQVKPMVQSFLQMPKMAIYCTCVSDAASARRVLLLEYGSEYRMTVKQASAYPDVCNVVELAAAKI